MEFDLYNLYSLMRGLHSFPLELANCLGSKPTWAPGLLCVLSHDFFPSLNFRILFHRGNNNNT